VSITLHRDILLRAGTVMAAIGGLVIAADLHTVAGAAVTPAATASATVTVNLTGTARGTLAAGYAGLSYESNPSNGQGGVNSGKFDAVGNLPQLLRTLGPGVIRFGGNSVDRTYASATSAALAGLVRLANATGYTYVYSTNLAHYNAANTGGDAAAVNAALGTRLKSFACGNEPDLYVNNAYRPSGYGSSQYVTDANACINNVRSRVPSMRISGPDTAGPGWLSNYASAERGRTNLLATHHYPLSNCGGVNGTATGLIAASKRSSEAGLIASAAATASRNGMPLIMSEVNSAACSGIVGVSNTFVSALWAVDYELAGVENGATGMYFHGALDSSCTTYTPLCQVGTNTYAAQPLYYGLLFTHLLGNGPVLPTTVSSNSNVAAHTVRGADGRVRTLVENLSNVTLTSSVRAGNTSGSGSLLALTASSLTATSGVHIQGSAVATNGTFTPGTATAVTCAGGSCGMTLQPYSAVILTLPA
jgi:hypothetical protein